jgi:subtilisin-like proprotein convertase family protein/subtilisin family serine protease
MRRAFWVLAWALLTLLPAGGAGAAEISTELARRVAEESLLPVWVFLSDKGEIVQSAQALDHLSPRALERRAKVREPQALSDWRDLPLAAEYLSFFEDRGWPLRARSRWLNAVSINVDSTQLEMLAAQPFVKGFKAVAASQSDSRILGEVSARAPVDRDTRIDYGFNEAELQQMRIPEVHDLGYHGEGVVIGMLDTGCNTQHEALQSAEILGVWDFVQGDNVIFDQIGDHPQQDHHGSRTFSTLAADFPGSMVGVAFEASYFLAKTEDESGEEPVEEDYWVAGLEWLEAQGCDIVNSSVGYSDWYNYEDLDGDTALSTLAADHAASLGLLVVAAVGNERFDFGHMIAPSDGDSVLAVGSVDADGDYSWFSSPGPSYDGRLKPDVMARGEDNFTIDPSSWSGYLQVSGTSYCTALMTGAAALVLCANPELGPMDILEALRHSGDHSANPDNDYGWGLVDALAALEYFKPRIDHDPLPDSEDSVEGYPVIAEIETTLGSITSAQLYYRVNSGEWASLPMEPVGDILYQAAIPAQEWDSEVSYYLLAENDMGHEATHPQNAPNSWHSFEVGEDLQAPEIEHYPLSDQSVPAWPATVEARVEDNLGVAWVRCEYWLNGDRQPDFDLLSMAEDSYGGTFECGIQEGDSIRYRIVAVDMSGAANEAAHPLEGEHAFAIRGAGGLVLLLVDGESFRNDGGKLGPDKEWLSAPPIGGRSMSGDWIEEALTQSGYLVQREDLGESDPQVWDEYDLLIVSSSDRMDPLAPEGFSEALELYASEGGRILCEGGELAYKFREDSSFLSSVLHVSGWVADYGGDLELSASGHAIANFPYTLPGSIPFEYDYYNDQDIAQPSVDADLIYGTETYAAAAGIVAFDADPDPAGGQSIFFSFNLGKLPESDAKDLICNAAAWLLAEFTSGSGAVSGQVVLGDQSDHSEVLITLTGQEPFETDSDGVFYFENVWAGNVLLHAEKQGYEPVDSVLALAEGQIISGLILEMQPVIVLDYFSQPELTIPDNFPSGVIDTIWIAEHGDLLRLSVDMDISHSYIGDLRLILIGPDGTQVILHDRSGGDADDIFGNYPETLIPSENLNRFWGKSIYGAWCLRVADHAAQDTGVLHAWGLHLTISETSTEVEAGPPAFELHGNWPNPFNPSTGLEFSLETAGPVRLDIFDLQGRRLITLTDEILAVGTYSVLWHGYDRKGRSLPSGVYFARLSAGEQKAVHKMVLLK